MQCFDYGLPMFLSNANPWKVHIANNNSRHFMQKKVKWKTNNSFIFMINDNIGVRILDTNTPIQYKIIFPTQIQSQGTQWKLDDLLQEVYFCLWSGLTGYLFAIIWHNFKAFDFFIDK